MDWIVQQVRSSSLPAMRNLETLVVKESEWAFKPRRSNHVSLNDECAKKSIYLSLLGDDSEDDESWAGMGLSWVAENGGRGLLLSASFIFPV